MAFTIPIPKSPFVDPNGIISREWFLFLTNLLGAVANGASGTATQVLHGGSVGYSSVVLTTDVAGTLPIANGGSAASTAAGARTNFGLGTIATQDASNVNITGGNISGITALAAISGGTGISGYSVGDILYADTPTSFTRLAVGSASQVLTGGTVPSWSAGSTPAASQAEMEAATSTTVFVTPGRQQFHPGMAKVWCEWNTVTSTTITSSYNVTSLTDNGVGLTTINFTTQFSSGNYGYTTGTIGATAGTDVRGWIVLDGTGASGAPTTKTSSAIKFATTAAATAAPGDATCISVALFGDQ